MAEITTRRASEIRRGIRIARADEAAMREFRDRYYVAKWFYPEDRKQYWMWKIVSHVFPYIVGFIAPLYPTLAGTAWRRELRRISGPLSKGLQP